MFVASFMFSQYPTVEKIRAVIDFLRKLPSIDDLNEVARAVFG